MQQYSGIIKCHFDLHIVWSQKHGEYPATITFSKMRVHFVSSESMRSRLLIISNSSMYSSHLASTNMSISCRVQFGQWSWWGIREESPSAGATLGRTLCVGRSSDGVGKGMAIDGDRSSNVVFVGYIARWVPCSAHASICAAGGGGTTCSNLHCPIYKHNDNYTL